MKYLHKSNTNTKRNLLFCFISGWLRRSTLQVQWDGTQGSFRKLHRFGAFKKNTFDCGFIFCVKSFENEVSLVGVVNRGEGCARENAIGIYARVKVWRHFMTSVWMFNFFTFSASHEMDPAHCENRRMLKAVQILLIKLNDVLFWLEVQLGWPLGFSLVYYIYT